MKFAENIYTLISDDVRHEEGGKISLMGIYSKDIIINKLPAILPKLCLTIFVAGVKEPFSGVKIVTKIPETEDFVLDLPSPPDMNLYSNVQMVMALSPFRVKVPAFVCVS